jgi:Fur family ferric uptake transcriptional regulator
VQRAPPPPPRLSWLRRTVEVEGPTVERWASAVAAEHGYVEVSHTLEIFGVCGSCR